MSKISIEVSEQEHKQIKALAALNGTSIREFMLASVFDDVDLGKSPGQVTLETLRDLRAGKDVIHYKDVQEMMADLWKD